MASGCLLAETLKVASKFWDTRFTHKKKIKLDFFGSLAIRAPPAPCLTRLSIEAFIADEPRNLVHIVRRRRKAASEQMIKQKGRLLEVWWIYQPNKRSGDRIVCKKVIAHIAANDGSCKRGFVKKLADMAAEVAPALKISQDDINNRVRRIPSNSNRKFHQQFHTMQLTAQPVPQILTWAFLLKRVDVVNAGEWKEKQCTAITPGKRNIKTFFTWRAHAAT